MVYCVAAPRSPDAAENSCTGVTVNKASLRKWLLAGAGVVAVGIGIVGIFVPILPTTPLLLLAAACFIRSSDRLYNWLIGHRWFGSYIRNYREHRAITRRAKVAALVLLWSVIGYSAVAAVSDWWMRALLGAIAVGVSIHLLRLRTYTPETAAKAKPVASLD